MSYAVCLPRSSRFEPPAPNCTWPAHGRSYNPESLRRGIELQSATVSDLALELEAENPHMVNHRYFALGAVSCSTLACEASCLPGCPGREWWGTPTPQTTPHAYTHTRTHARTYTPPS